MAARAATKSAPKTTTKTTTKTATKATPAKVAKTTLAPDPVPTPAVAMSAPTRDAAYPIVDRNPWGIIALVLGIIGLGGVGTIIAGVISKQHTARDIIFGVLQLIPVVGQIWGLVWGILIFVKGNK